MDRNYINKVTIDALCMLGMDDLGDWIYDSNIDKTDLLTVVAGVHGVMTMREVMMNDISNATMSEE